jgi:hypothetical protein
MDSREKSPAPPYIAYKTLRNFLDRFKQGTPSRIDVSVMSSMSGAARSQVTTALKFLGLTDNSGVPTDTMNRLVKSQGDDWKKNLKEVLATTYPNLFRDGFSLQTTTAKHLREEFEKTSATGETLDRCIAFFTAAAKDAGIQLSPYLKEGRKPRVNGTVKSRKAPSAHEADDRGGDDSDSRSETKTWEELLLDKFPTFDPSWPDEVKTKWFEGFDKLMKSREA